MSAVTDFLTDPIAFMSNNVVGTPNLKTKVYGRPQKLFFKEPGFPTGRKIAPNQEEQKIPYYLLKDAAEQEEGVLSYICDYQDTEISYQVLDREADYCFTWTMNGCTFGISAKQDGTILVSHGNAKDEPERGQMTQEEFQRELAIKLHGEDVVLLEPKTYRPQGKNIATTFGIRKNKKWKFYYQVYTIKAGVTTLHGVHEIAAWNTQV